MEDVNSDKMIDRPVYSNRVHVTDVTDLSVKDAVVWRDGMSQNLHLFYYRLKSVYFFLNQKSTYFKGIV